MNSWQDISSAPRDGTRFLLGGNGPHGFEIVLAGRGVYGWEDDHGMSIEAPDISYHITPSHWMPLPEPPA